MATEILNLIGIQSKLQNPALISNKDLLKYADGSNPEVPGFLALLEMNRRKQIEENSSAYDKSNQDSVKNQIANSLLNAPQTNPAANPFVANPAAPLMQNSGITANPVKPQLLRMPQGINPTIPAPQPQMPTNGPLPEITGARGGLMSLINRHSKANNFAGGGIVAFGDPNLNPNEEQLVINPAPSTVYEGNPYRIELTGMAPDNKNYPGNLKENIPPEPKTRGLPYVAAPKQRTYEDIVAGLPAVEPMVNAYPNDLSRTQAYTGIKESQELAGVSKDPYAETKKRQAALEARQLEEYKQGGVDRLIAQMVAFATADPAKGFGYAAAFSASASKVLEKEQNALRDKQETASIEFQKSIAKEEDAKARGDAKDIEAAVAKRTEAQMKYTELQQAQQKLERDRQVLAKDLYQIQEEKPYKQAMASAALTNAASTRLNAEGQVQHWKSADDLAQSTKLTAEDQLQIRTDRNLNSDKFYERLLDAIKPNNPNAYQPGTEEYNKAFMDAYNYKAQIYRQKGLIPPPPPKLETTPQSTRKKQGLWEFLFGPKTSTTSPSPDKKVVPFDQLP